jgi:hypothetical protein
MSVSSEIYNYCQYELIFLKEEIYRICFSKQNLEIIQEFFNDVLLKASE